MCPPHAAVSSAWFLLANLKNLIVHSSLAALHFCLNRKIFLWMVSPVFLNDIGEGLRPEPGFSDGWAKGGEEPFPLKKLLPLTPQTCQPEELQGREVPGQEVSIPGQEVTVSKAQQSVSVGVQWEITCDPKGLVTAGVWFGWCSSFPVLDVSALSPLHHSLPHLTVIPCDHNKSHLEDCIVLAESPLLFGLYFFCMWV